MHSDLESLAKDIQTEADAAARLEMGEAVYQRWRNPQYMGALPDADATATLRGNCGDQMRLFLKFNGERVSQASFQTDGCGPSVVSASHAAELALGRTVEELLAVSPGDILAAAGGLPEDHEHCAFLAAEVLHAAVRDYLSRLGK